MWGKTAAAISSTNWHLHLSEVSPETPNEPQTLMGKIKDWHSAIIQPRGGLLERPTVVGLTN